MAQRKRLESRRMWTRWLATGLLGCVGCGDRAATDVASTGGETPGGQAVGAPGKSPADEASTPDRRPQGAGAASGDSAPAPAPSPAEVWAARLAEAKKLFEAGEFDRLAERREAWNADEAAGAAPADVAEQLADFERRIAEQLAARAAADRAKRLDEARALMDQGKLDEALRAVGDVLARNPTDEQRQTAAGVTEEVERRRKARRQLKSWMQLLASDERKNVQTAQTQLLQDPDTAVGMVLEALGAAEPGPAASNYLETLRLLNRPEATVPAMLELLGRSDRAPLWPDVVRELSEAPTRGLGEKLLELATRSPTPEQREAALRVLARAVDPPVATLPRLLPLLTGDGPETTAALVAAAHAVRTHQQFDWVGDRALDEQGSADDAQARAELGARLVKLAGAATPERAEAALAARTLAALLGAIPSRPATDVKVLRAEAELPESPAAGAVDGTWNSTDLKTLWRYPADRKGSILLDLGAEHVVTGVRLWNLNEPGAVQRGWKDVEVFVSTSPAELAPVATGVAPTAPGAAATIDYSTTIPVFAIRGRYVRLQAKSVWAADGPNGLSEIQILVAP